MRWRLAAVLVGFTALVLLVQNIPLASYLRTVERDSIITALQRDAFTLAGYSVTSLELDAPTPATQRPQRTSSTSTPRRTGHA